MSKPRSKTPKRKKKKNKKNIRKKIFNVPILDFSILLSMSLLIIAGFINSYFGYEPLFKKYNNGSKCLIPIFGFIFVTSIINQFINYFK
tara:strand:+ start:367 stop:633 length:267 start_codon:yes stop_codon:yes gene_type:complete